MSIVPSMDSKTQLHIGENTDRQSYHLSLIGSSSSLASDDYGSHAPGIRKAMKILEAQFSHSNVSSSSSPVHNNDEDVINIDDNHHVAGLSQSHEPPSDGDASVKKKKNVDDGRIHSLPHKKYGPYTCSKCYQVLATSQKFASHVTSNHYKFDSVEEKRKRYISKIRKKPKLDNGQTTFVPVVPVIDQPIVASLVNNDDQNHSSPLGLPLKGVKLELDLVDG